MDLTTGQSTTTLRDSAGVYAVAFSPDGGTLATGNYDDGGGPNDTMIRLWNLTTGRSTAITHTADVRSLAFSPDGKILASATDESVVRLWKVP